MRAVILTTIIYLAQLAALPTLHVLTAGHGDDHDTCQICQNLVQSVPGVVDAPAILVSLSCFPVILSEEDAAHEVEISTPLCRGPPAT